MAAKQKLATVPAPRADSEWTGKTQTCADQRQGHLERRKQEDGSYVTSWVPSPVGAKAPAAGGATARRGAR